MECKWKDEFCLPGPKFSRENGISWKVVQNSQTEFPNGKCAYHLSFETSSRPYAIFYLGHVGCVNMAAAESSVFQYARTSKVVLVIRKSDLNSAIA